MNKIWCFYDIKYEGNRKDLPSKLTIDLNEFEWVKKIKPGPMNLNFKAFRAIKEITGCVATSCKVKMVQKKI